MRILFGYVLFVVIAAALGAQPVSSVRSPGGLVEISFSAGERASWRLSYKGKPVIAPSNLGLELQGAPPLGPDTKIVASRTSAGDETYRMPHGKSNPVRNRYNELSLDFVEQRRGQRSFTVEARAYDDGAAFRYLIPKQPAITELRLAREATQFAFAREGTAWPLILNGYRTSYEDNYHKLPLSALHPGWLVALPLLVELPGAAWAAVTEAHIENYAGMYLGRGSGARTLEARLAPRADAPELAVTIGTPCRTPWRVVMTGDEPGRLIESNLIINLNPPSKIADTSWIKPGKAAWPWWSGEVAKVAASGMNTGTNKYYVDFAAENGLEYLLIDEGWSFGGRGRDADLTRAVPELDLPEVLSYARSKGVKIWLWAHWTLVDRQMEEAFRTFAKWGVAGVKIDFMDRDDQWMVDFYHRVLEAAARHKLMIDFHGAYKPDGIRRTWPNLMTREGVLGLEYTKWSARVNPDHNLVLPFTRMLAGPMDYTPGGFRNVTPADFTPRMREPAVLGTRAHHVASFVVYESAFLCLADHPDAYRGQPGFEFVKAVPAAWEETRVLDGKVGEYIAIARRQGKQWFIGAMAGWSGREIEIPLSFLDAGAYSAEIWSDAPDAGTVPEHIVRETRPVDRAARLKAVLAPGGGWAARIRPR